jgi:ADP-ribosylglycohydrolase
MTRPDVASGAAGCLLGLAAGDALGGPTEGKTAADIAARWGRVTGFVSAGQSGSDDTEYALFNARLLLRYGRGIDAGTIAGAWLSDIVGTANTFKGAGFSEMMAIRNLRSGLRPPASGRHCHSWSDGLAMRSAPFGIVWPGEPLRAADLAERDGTVSHDGEGILAGRMVAAAVAVALAGAPLEAVLEGALSAVPADSWCFRSTKACVAVARESSDVWSALPALLTAAALRRYYWTDIGPEAVGLAFGLVAASNGDPESAILGGVNIGRDADTIAAIAGAVTGAMAGEARLPVEWVRRIGPARGTCIAAVRGMSIRETALALAGLRGEERGSA